jgi:23S rRNA (uracil1939-C5)-methyltransferase
MHLFGPDHIVEELIISNPEGKKSSLKFKISPTSFFQPNLLQAELLYSKALVLASVSEDSIAFDLYCGTATLAMAFASKVKQVIGIEINPHAIFDAQMNKEFNAVSNLELFQGDVGNVLKEHCFQEKISRPIDLVMVDPPRGGLDQNAKEHILSLKPEKILYISCNPFTQAKDIQVFEQAGYICTHIQPIDQFPHTMHVENIALLMTAK